MAALKNETVLAPGVGSGISNMTAMFRAQVVVRSRRV